MPETVALPQLRPDVKDALASASDAKAYQDVVRLDPLCLVAWASLGDLAYDGGDDVASYAYSRVGYHRGLDLLRGNGWHPGVQVHWADETNRGFLRALHGLMRAAASIGEGAEARRCREFLLELDPSDHFAVDPIAPKDLSRRLPD
jgi:hypothetical protein